MTEPRTPEPRVPVRWGWIIGCIMLGLAGIAAGLLLVPDRTTYVANVLAGIGTTLLLVGIVVLLERRIVGTAAKACGGRWMRSGKRAMHGSTGWSVILKIGYPRSGLEPMRRMWMP